MRILIAVLLAILLWLQYRLWDGPGSISEVRRLQGEVTLQQGELERLTTRNQILEAEVLDLKHGMEALEERARMELGMIRQGEVFYQTIDSPATPTDVTPNTPPAKDKDEVSATKKSSKSSKASKPKVAPIP